MDDIKKLLQKKIKSGNGYAILAAFYFIIVLFAFAIVISTDDSSLLAVVILFAVVSVSCLCRYLKANKKQKKLIDEIINCGEAQAVVEDINACGPVKKGNEYYLGEKVFISKNIIVPYRDIVWVYSRTTYYYIFEFYAVVIKDRFGNETAVSFKKKNEEMEALVKKLYEKNDKILFGYSSSNNKYYKNLIKQKKA